MHGQTIMVTAVNGNNAKFGFVHLSNTFLLFMMTWFIGTIELVEFTITHSVLHCLLSICFYCNIFLYPLLEDSGLKLLHSLFSMS